MKRFLFLAISAVVFIFVNSCGKSCEKESQSIRPQEVEKGNIRESKGWQRTPPGAGRPQPSEEKKSRKPSKKSPSPDDLAAFDLFLDGVQKTRFNSTELKEIPQTTIVNAFGIHRKGWQLVDILKKAGINQAKELKVISRDFERKRPRKPNPDKIRHAPFKVLSWSEIIDQGKKAILFYNKRGKLKLEFGPVRSPSPPLRINSVEGTIDAPSKKEKAVPGMRKKRKKREMMKDSVKDVIRIEVK